MIPSQSDQTYSGVLHPDAKFVDHTHAYVVGLVASALMDNAAFAVDIDTRCPVIRVRLGTHRYELIVSELQ